MSLQFLILHFPENGIALAMWIPPYTNQVNVYNKIHLVRGDASYGGAHRSAASCGWPWLHHRGSHSRNLGVDFGLPSDKNFEYVLKLLCFTQKYSKRDYRCTGCWRLVGGSPTHGVLVWPLWGVSSTSIWVGILVGCRRGHLANEL